MSSCSFTCRRLLFPLFLQVFTTIPIRTSQVCLMLNCMYYFNHMPVVMHLLLPISPVSIVRVVDFSFCNASWINAPSLLHVYGDIPRFVLGTTLLVLAVIQTLKQSVEMYKATKQWQPNRYMQQLMRDGIIYFLVYVSLYPLSHLHSLPSRSPHLTHEYSHKAKHFDISLEFLGTHFSISLFYSEARLLLR